MPLRPLLAVVPIVALLALAAPAGAAVAPGQVTFPLESRTIPSIDVMTPNVGVARPDGGVVLAGVDRRRGVRLLAVRRDGRPDPGFGRRGLVRVAVPFDNATIGPMPVALLGRPDGRMLVAYRGAPRASLLEPGRIQVAGLTAAGALDPSFGQVGVTDPGIQLGCDAAACSPAALQPDGSLLLAGTVSRREGDERDPYPVSSFSWVVVRLTPDGRLDQGFGDGGIATVALGGAIGLSVAVAPDGGILTVGVVEEGVSRIARLTPDGLPDLAFGGGSVAAGQARDLLVRPDGSVLAIGPDGVRRFTPSGAPDLAFGEQGLVAGVTGKLLAVPDGVVAVDQPDGRDGRARLRVARIAAGGALAVERTVTLAFGGGYASRFARINPPRVTPLVQATYRAGRAVARPDGSILVPGGVAVVEPTGEGEGVQHEEAALVGLAPDLRLDPQLGGPPRAARLRLKLPAQRAGYAVKVVATTSGPGLAEVRITYGKRVLARSTAAVWRTGRQRISVLLTRTGRRLLLRSDVRRRVTVTARFRDLVGRRASARTRGYLR